MSALEIRPVTATFGAEIHGVDLAASVDDDLLATIRDAIHEHQVVFFPGQDDLDDEAHMALMLRLGDGYIHPLGRAAGLTEPWVEHIVDDADHPPYQDGWHTDVSWDPRPPTLGSLRAIDMPQQGGDTLWMSTYAAYDRLSDTFRAVLTDLEAHHDLGPGLAFRTKVGEHLYQQAKTEFGDTRHPVIAEHPDTGRRYLYVNPGFTRSIVGMTADESAAVLGYLTALVVDPHHGLRRHWAQGDFCIWDERSTLHSAMPDHFPARREMARVAVRERAAA